MIFTDYGDLELLPNNLNDLENLSDHIIDLTREVGSKFEVTTILKYHSTL